MKKFIPFTILVILIVVIATSTYNINNKSNRSENLSDPESWRNSSNEENIGFQKVNLNLPDFSIKDLYNNKIKFSKKDLLGKYSVINFFASWCTTCHAEHHLLLKLQQEKIIDIYGIAWRDIDANTKKYLEENQNPYKKVATDSIGLFTKIAKVEAVPETWIIDKNGNVVMRYYGNLQEFSIDEIKDFLLSKQNIN